MWKKFCACLRDGYNTFFSDMQFIGGTAACQLHVCYT
uniref:Uncharacterized protein n=1 Tax=Anguilla anguilla TaxID=7936 RepID=A0A0E9XC88_ANGAN